MTASRTPTLSCPSLSRLTFAVSRSSQPRCSLVFNKFEETPNRASWRLPATHPQFAICKIVNRRWIKGLLRLERWRVQTTLVRRFPENTRFVVPKPDTCSTKLKNQRNCKSIQSWTFQLARDEKFVPSKPRAVPRDGSLRPTRRTVRKISERERERGVRVSSPSRRIHGLRTSKTPQTARSRDRGSPSITFSTLVSSLNSALTPCHHHERPPSSQEKAK